MRKFVCIAGLACFCLVSVAHAYPQDGGYGKRYSNNQENRSYGCEKRIARLEEKRQTALKYNRVEQVKGLDRALENTRKYCMERENTLVGYEQMKDDQYSKKSDTGRDQINGQDMDTEQDKAKGRSRWAEVEEDAKEKWNDLKESTGESYENFKDNMDEKLEALKEKTGELKEQIKEMEKDLSEAIERGAESDTVKSLQEKLDNAKKSMQEFLNE